MRYDEAVSYINAPERNGSRFGLASIARLLEALGHPEKALRFIHVAGTNGKGSTCAMLDAMYRRGGYRVGLFTSPYIRRFNDRIRVDGRDIPDDVVARVTAAMKAASEAIVARGEEPPTTFELVTAMAMVHFAEEKCDVVILEVGLGGLLDCTNIIDAPLAAVITPIAYDHCDVLGHTLSAIAANKAGIIKKGTVVVTAPQEPEARAVIAEKSAALGVEVVEATLGRAEKIVANQEENRFLWRGKNGAFEVNLSLLGDYQQENAALALTVVEALNRRGFLPLDEKVAVEALSQVTWPGRLQLIQRMPDVVLDGSHNPHGMANLAKNLSVFNYDKLHLVMAVMADKDVRAMVAALAPQVNDVIATTVPMPRAMKAEDLAAIWREHRVTVESEPSLEVAVEGAIAAAGKDDLVLIAGSLYFISAAGALLGGWNTE